MKHPTARRAVRLAVALAATSSLGTGIASASTWTVDDDKAQCPSAGFTSIQAAVDQAAPHDTVVVCDGTYAEQSTPATAASSPAQAGSRNGLTITKALTIKGAGASKVIIMPAPSLGATLAGTAPYLRDGGGNVITVERQSLGASDSNENAVDISGVTVTSPSAYVEAGIAFFNTGGSVTDSTIGPLTRAADATALAAAPHGWGIIMTNSLQGSGEGTVRRDLTIADDLITGYQSGGVLVDDGLGTDGAAGNTARAGIAQYATITGTRVVGSASTVFPQTGVKFTNGARGSVSTTEIVNHRYATDLRQSVGLLLADVATGIDPQNAARPAFSATGLSLSGNGYGAFNANATDDAVNPVAPVDLGSSWFGCASGPVVGAASASSGTGCQGVSGTDVDGDASVTTTALTAAPTALSVPGATADAAPTGRLVSGDLTVLPGHTIAPVVSAADDFGVKKVSVLLDGTVIASKATVPYELSPSWTPTARDAGKTFTLVAKVTDSAGQVTTTAPTTVKVLGTPFAALVADAGTYDAGAVTVGASTGRTLTFTNADDAALRLDAVDADGAGFAVAGGTCAKRLVLAPGASCTVAVTFAPTSAGPAAGTLTVTPLGDADAARVALSGTGVAATTPEQPGPPEPPGPPAAPPETPETPKAPSPPSGPKAPARPSTTTRHAIGPLTALVVKAPALSSSGAIKLGSFRCATKCTVKLSGTIVVGGKRTKVALTKVLSAHKATTVTLKLSSSLRKRLAKAGKGTLALRIAVGAKSKVITLKVTA